MKPDYGSVEDRLKKEGLVDFEKATEDEKKKLRTLTHEEIDALVSVRKKIGHVSSTGAKAEIF